MDEKLAELVGILLGDGHLGLHKYEVSVTENSLLDTKHIIFVHNTIKEFFNKASTLYINKYRRVLRSKIYSKSIQKFLISQFNLTIGKKIRSRNRIPQEFYSNTRTLIACIRGIFDTDGTFCRHRLKDPMIEIDCCNATLKNSVLEALRLLRFRVSFSGRKIYIYSKHDIMRFFETIKPRNEHHLIKYNYWLNTGIVPTNEDITVNNLSFLDKVFNSPTKEWVRVSVEDLNKVILNIN